MSEGDKYTCPLCVRALQQQERREQRKAEAAAAAEIEREAKEAQAARKAKLVCRSCPTQAETMAGFYHVLVGVYALVGVSAHICHQVVVVAGCDKAHLVANSNIANTK